MKLDHMKPVNSYRILPSKHPWALEIHGPKKKTGVGAYTEKPFGCLTHIHATIVSGGVGSYTGMGAYSREYDSTSMTHN